MISIITINLNNAKGLQKTVQSVISQTYRDYEFIVIDGASKDESVSVIEKYSDNISHWVSEPDNGVFEAMNKGIKLAKGEYCLFLNSDDVFASNSVLEKIFKGKEQTAPFISGNQINDFGTHTSIVKNKGRSLTLYDFYLGTIKHQATFIRRNLFDEYGLYDENLKIVSDWKFFLQTIGLHNLQPQFVDVDIVIFAWDGLSTSPKWQKLHDKEKEKVLSENIPQTIREDYITLHHLKNYEYIADKMQKSSLLRFLIKSFTKILG